MTYSGLGTGISANAFAQHGIATTIVEIDPAVYDAARQYFGLSDPGNNNVFLQDARGWVRSRRAMVEAEDPSAIKYDVIVHDCFSGGGVPEHLFSIEFWNDLKTILSTEGVVAVVSSFSIVFARITYLVSFGQNFAGKLASDSSQAILVTLLRAFGQCRAFHDHVEPISPEHLHSNFVNIVSSLIGALTKSDDHAIGLLLYPISNTTHIPICSRRGLSSLISSPSHSIQS